MFWKSKVNDGFKEDDQINTPVYTIPMEFYGGANPVIKFTNVEKIVQKKSGQPQEVVGTNSVTPPAVMAAGFLGSSKFLALLSVVLFVVFASGVGFYYWQMISKERASRVIPKNEQNNTTVVEQIIPTSTVENVTIVVPTTTEATQEQTTSPSLSGGSIEFPSILLGNSGDLDKDGLTDGEEELFLTDTGKPDTDSDGYEDRTEIFNLYSPTVVAPTRLISTEVVKEYINPMFNYRVYYPTSWAVGNVDQEYRDVLFSTITGENIEIRVFDKQIGQNFDGWFAEWAKGEQLGSLQNFLTVFKGQAMMRNDSLVYYFEDDQKIYIMVYHVTGSSAVNYRNVISMMARSFRRSSEADAALPEQKIIRGSESETQ